MGKIEKLVVLGVLFLIVVVLGVAQLYNPDETQASYSPDGDAPRVDLVQEPALRPGTDPRRPGSGGAGDLDPVRPGPGAGVAGGTGADDVPDLDDPGPAAPRGDDARRDRPQPARPRPVGILTAVDGLEDAIDPAFKLYRVAPGDTWSSIADRYYGDTGFAALLRRHNEGLATPPAGEEVWVPIEDDGLGAQRIHVVAEDESLWVIAREHLGAGHRWSEVYEANRDVLASPESLRPGMQLVIPAQ